MKLFAFFHEKVDFLSQWAHLHEKNAATFMLLKRFSEYEDISKLFPGK